MAKEFSFTTVNGLARPVGTVLLTDDEAKTRCWHFSKGNCISYYRKTKPCDLIDSKCHMVSPTIRHDNETDTLTSANKH